MPGHALLQWGKAVWNTVNLWLGRRERDGSLTWGLLAKEAVEEVHGGIQWAAWGLCCRAASAKGAQREDPRLGPPGWPTSPAVGHAGIGGCRAQ